MIVRVRNYPVSSLVRDFFGPRFLHNFLFDERPGTRSELIGVSPSVDLAEYENESVLVAVVPGIAKDQLNISFKEGIITIRGERKKEELPEDGRMIRSEIGHGPFVRSVQIPHPVEVEKISAELSDGVLKVTMPKADHARPKTITIR